jgi:hypothetical protein
MTQRERDAQARADRRKTTAAAYTFQAPATSGIYCAASYFALGTEESPTPSSKSGNMCSEPGNHPP